MTFFIKTQDWTKAFWIAAGYFSVSLALFLNGSSLARAEIEYVPSVLSSPPLTTPLTVSQVSSQQIKDDEEVFPESSFGSPISHPDSSLHSLPLYQEGGSRKPTSITSSSSVPLIPKSLRGVQEVSVIATEQGFFPKILFVTRDIPVRLFITGVSNRSLCILIDTFQIRRQVQSHKIEEIEFLPSTPGTYRFYCPINGMEGTLFVKDVASISTSEGN